MLLILGLQGCSKDWPAFRHNILRSGNQLNNSRLADPAKVSTLQIRWTFQPPNAGRFRASPVVSKGQVYIGNGNGYFYALDADTGNLLWQYPPVNAPPLTSTFTCNPSSEGLASSAMIANINGTDAVIFGAPDRSIGTGLGSGRLFALNATTGAEIWKSPEIAAVRNDGVTHEQIGYSSPLVFNDHVYVGVADHCDNPIQNGKVVAVRLSNGSIDNAFTYSSTSTRGGGVWNSVAGWDDIYLTTGNTRNGNGPQPPAVNHGLSLLRLNQNTGAVLWQLQPVPYELDQDPDWATGATVMLASCGTLVVSTPKDGWTWAASADTGGVRWAFPTGPWTNGGFRPGDGTFHGDTDYKRPGAAWGDVYIGAMGGLDTTTDLAGGYRRLHALNVCASDWNRVRWIKDIPATGGFGYPLGPPTVTKGIVFVGTNEGHLVVLADPSVRPSLGWRCSDPNISAPICALWQFLIPNSVIRLVPDPAQLADVTLPGAGSIFGEPALAGDRVYIAGDGGKVFMLQADP